MPNEQVLTGPPSYGAYYVGITVPVGVAAKGDIYAYADRVEVTPGGTLILWCERAATEGRPAHTYINLALAAGSWTTTFAASVWDGHPVAVEHWDMVHSGEGADHTPATPPTRRRAVRTT